MWYAIAVVAGFVAGFVVCFIWRSKLVRELIHVRDKLTVEIDKLKE
jgi:hypothetical protein